MKLNKPPKKYCNRCAKSLTSKYGKHNLHKKCATEERNEYRKKQVASDRHYYKKKYAKSSVDPYKFRARHIKNKFYQMGINHESSFVFSWLDRFSLCFYCKQIMRYQDMSIDHIQPLSRGGANTIENLHLVHKVCNQMKGMLTHEEFIKLLKFCDENKQLGDIVKIRLKQSAFIYRGGKK